MLFNGIDLKPYIRIIDIRGRGIINRQVNAIAVEGMDGEHFSSVDTPSKYLEVDIEIRAKEAATLREKIDELNAILATEQPVPIVFPDEPDMTYYGTPEGSDEIGEYVHLSKHQGTIYIRRSDPFKYGPELTADFPSDTVIVENPGTADADPIFELTAKEQTTLAMVSNGEQYMMVGRPVNVDDTPTSDRERILNDDASSTVGWSAMTGGAPLFNLGVVGGNMISNGHAFLPETYGTNPNGWVGPAIRRSMSEQLQDFEIEIDIAMLNFGSGVGRITVLGLDENDEMIFSMGMMDGTNSYPNNMALFGVGPNNRTWIRYQGDNNRVVWNNARLMLRIRRRGQWFEGWIARKLDDGGLAARHWDRYHDSYNEYQQKLAQIVIYMAKAKHYDTFPMLFHHITVTKLINLADYEIPYIANEGDIITFDHSTRDCYINGEPVSFDFGADFFKLVPGENTIAVLPDDIFDAVVKFIPRYR